MLRIRRADLDRIRSYAEEEPRVESCGILAGVFPEILPVFSTSREARVEEVHRVSNTHAGSRHNRYEIDPREFLRVDVDIRSRNLEAIGILHSHPGHPAIPSEHDRERAWPGLSYLILSLDESGRVRAERSWVLPEAGGLFEEEAIEVH